MKPQELEMVDRYLAEKLTEQESEEFEHRLQSDDKFRGQFEQVKLIITGIQCSARMDELAKIKRIENTLPKIVKKDKPKIIKLFIEYGSYAAAACLLIFIVYALFHFTGHGKHENNKKLFTVYFEPYPNIVYPTTRFDNDSVTKVQKAFAEYDQRNYPKAITLFKALPGFNKDQTISFYLAISYLSIHDGKNAEQLLLQLLNKNQAINDKVQWYLGLCYLENNKIGLATEQFRNLAGTENNYTQNAIKILKKIK